MQLATRNKLADDIDDIEDIPIATVRHIARNRPFILNCAVRDAATDEKCVLSAGKLIKVRV